MGMLKDGNRPIYADEHETSTKIESDVDALRAMVRFQLCNNAVKTTKEVLKKVRETMTKEGN